MTREEALQRLRMLHLVAEDPEDKVAILMAIQALKHPEQKKDRWISSDIGTICSNCYYKLETTGLLSYCPHCGAKMG